MDTKLVIFDFDGTILDSSKIWENVISEILNKKDNYDIFFRMDLNSNDMYYYMYQESDKSLKYENFIKKIDETAFKYYIRRTPKPYIKEYINMLKNKGIYVIIATKNNKTITKKYLDNYNIIYDDIYCEGDYNALKSDGTLFTLIKEKYNFNFNEMLFIDDNYYNLKSAKEKGIKIFGISDNFYKGFNKDDKIKKISNKFIDDYKELFIKEIF